MIRRLLIANRGEIVCRITRTAQRLGVTSIAVYSEADRDARHVRTADEAYYLGPAPAAESYLDIAKILGVAKRVGADAVHPGYGFLSENPDFAQACVDAGLIFVGPPAASIRAMGSKSASKAAMAAVGVPVAPGYHGEDQSAHRLHAEAQKAGFPLIIKASAGGGGKGMQVVNSVTEIAAAVDAAKRLARAAFGDDRLLLERYFPKARHVEVQVFADSHGGIVSLFDRDCSVQRRHQKIIEEAPAPGLRDEVRAAMSRAAIQSAQAVGYEGAGTVEFLVDEAQHFYFMEMNTRLQVEHPVTELIADVDLVEWQLRIAQGAHLPKTQSEILQRGAAMEARLYAEDPNHGYLPSVGRIAHLHWPDAVAGLRLDMGVDAGDEVSPFYDPMLGKVIAWGLTRGEAADRLRKALDDIEIIGVATNRALLTSVLADEEFRRGGVATDFLSARRGHLSFGDPHAADVDAVLAAVWCATRETSPDALWCDSRGWRLAADPMSTWKFADRTVVTEFRAPSTYVARIAGGEHMLRVVARGPNVLQVELSGQMQRVRVIEIEQNLHLFTAGRHAVLRVARTEDALEVSAGADQGSLLTPLPGTVVAVHVTPGQQVLRGAPLVTVEAMKMEHTLTAPYDGTVARVLFGLAERVAAGAILVELSPLETRGS
ncbi:MAG TPA: biotin carboxylase N-terminal domain-containing protein [Steroidobacteraceae bacterium]|jgi:3-methylcrotonyl-CoA carboxylase alpha subunit|nr:biotin carboxylase N-terminal domain-containing protein [Steroidobacteraceae bacterium]